MKRWLVCLVVVVVVGCAKPARVGIREHSNLSTDSSQQCAALCEHIGLSLDSVVIMAAEVGCVCRAASPPATITPPAASASTGGMAAIMLARQAAEQQNNRQGIRPTASGK